MKNRSGFSMIATAATIAMTIHRCFCGCCPPVKPLGIVTQPLARGNSVCSEQVLRLCQSEFFSGGGGEIEGETPCPPFLFQIVEIDGAKRCSTGSNVRMDIRITTSDFIVDIDRFEQETL